MVQLPHGRDTRDVPQRRGSCRGTDHTGDLSVCHLYFVQVTHVLAGSDGPHGCVGGVSLFVALLILSVTLKSSI